MGDTGGCQLNRCESGAALCVTRPGRTLVAVPHACPPPPADLTPSEPVAVTLVDVVGVALVDDLASPTILLGARRIEPALLAGQWELPGGKVEPGESWEEALHREIAEELGVRIRLGPLVPGPLADGRWQLSPRHVIAVWLAEVIDGQPRPLDEHDEVRWLTPATLHDVEWLTGDRPIIDAIAASLEGGPHQPGR